MKIDLFPKGMSMCVYMRMCLRVAYVNRDNSYIHTRSWTTTKEQLLYPAAELRMSHWGSKGCVVCVFLCSHCKRDIKQASACRWCRAVCFPQEHVHNEEMKEHHKITKGNLMNYTAKWNASHNHTLPLKLRVRIDVNKSSIQSFDHVSSLQIFPRIAFSVNKP